MTTATTLDSHDWPIADNGGRGGTGDDATPLAAGAGLVRAQQALDLGLVYDVTERDYWNWDYVDFLCTVNYTTVQVRMLVPGFAGCTRTLSGGIGRLNYPSFVADLSNGTDIRVLPRTMTKVSEGPETPAALEFGAAPAHGGDRDASYAGVQQRAV
ncbi:subtilisin-like protease SBT1.1 [Miscanthus floridulus]|uniref:subtilisin-like protease SBT1.1 n=1 Tax=Miscanthus floridulus TaxID=154761 RepID=UPI003457966E